MAEFIKVTVRVDKTQLNALRADVKSMQGQKIDVKLLASGSDAATNSIKKFSDATESAAKKSELLNNILKNAQWYYISSAVSAVTRAFKNAIETLKEVDTALVTVRKTTGYTEEQISALTKKTYELASAYGRTADELLNISANFARAGFGDQLEQMTELAALLENVGDLEGETASKFLISANAAWKLGGDYDALMQIIDGMNAVTNQAAVDMEALTTGITVAGSVFANAGETAQTYTAMVGTAVAATQRSGSEIARGLRTIAMNVRQIKGELEDGEIIDDASISDAAAALHSVGISVADANGELRLTSDVLADLAGKWDSLTTAEQSYLAQSLAGKRQANILTALMQNWGEVERQMELYANGAGSALKENEIYLDSWEAKSKKLSATWTEFISHLLETKTLKSGIGVLTSAIVFLDTGFSKFAFTVGLTTAAIGLLIKAFIALKATKGIVGLLLNYASAAIAAAGGSSAAAAAIAFLKAELIETLGALATNPLVWIAAAAAAIYTLYQHFEKISKEYETQKQALDEIESKYKSNVTELDNLKSRAEELTEAEKERLAVLELENYELDKQLQKQREQTFDAWRKTQTRLVADDTGGTGNAFNFGTHVESITADELKKAKTALMALDAEWEAGQHSQKGYNDGLKEIAASLKNSAEAIKIGVQVGKELEPEEAALLALYEYLVAEIGKYTSETEGNTKAKDENAGKTKELTAAEKTLKTAFEEVEKKSSLTYGTLAELDAIYPGLSKKILDANGKLTEEGKAALSTKAALFELISSMISASTTSLNFDSQISRLYDLAIAAGVAGAALDGIFGTAAGGPTFTEDGQLDVSAEKSYIRAKSNPERTLQSIIKDVKNELIKGDYVQAGSYGGGGGGGGSSASEKDEELERLKSIVSLRKQELAFLKESGASDKDILAKQKEIQAALHDEAEYLRTTEAYLNEDADALREVKALSTEWWSIQNDINDALEKAAKKLRDDIADVMGDIADSLKDSEEAITKPLQEQLDALEAAHDATKNRREEEEKILAVEKARIALENAQNERTVRQYNAATGQWEWVADAKKVESARQSLADAEAALADYYADQKYQAQKAALDAQIQNTKSAFDALKDAIDEAAKAIKDGKMSFEDAYAYIKAAMQQIYDDYGIDLSGELENIVGGFSTVNDNIRTLIDEIIATLSEAYFAAKAAGDWEGMERAHDAANGLRAIVGDEPTDASVDIANTKRASVIAEMQAHSAAWFDADEEERQRLANRNMELGTSMGWHREHGAWYDEDGKRVYDSGGILHGTGGIKATNEDEMILPPDMTAKLLRAEASGGFEALLAHLGIVTAAAQSYKALQTSKARTTIGTQNNGNIYNFAGISLSEQQARSMTVYDLAQMARNLSIAT